MDLEAAVKQYSRMLYRICIVILGSEEDTQDAVQDTFCKYLEKKPEFADAEHEKAWLIRATLQRACDIRRRAERRTVSLEAAAEAAGMTKPGASQVYYVDGSGGDAAVVYSQEAPGLLDGLRESLHHGIYAVVEYFD